MLNKLCLFVLATAILSSCATNGGNEAVQSHEKLSLDWMEGSWVDSNTFGFKDIQYVEKWEKINDTLYKGVKFQIKKGDTGTYSQENIKYINEKYYFYFQTEDAELVFVQDSISENYINFANTEDRFPHNNAYELNQDSLFVTLSGIAGGFERKSTLKTIKTQ